jgi:hypothetical protein
MKSLVLSFVHETLHLGSLSGRKMSDDRRRCLNLASAAGVVIFTSSVSLVGSE